MDGGAEQVGVQHMASDSPLEGEMERWRMLSEGRKATDGTADAIDREGEKLLSFWYICVHISDMVVVGRWMDVVRYGPVTSGTKLHR